MHSSRFPARAIVLLAVLAALGCSSKPPRAAGGATHPLLLPPEPAQPGPTYRINPGDELHVRFMYHPDQNEQVPVRPDGCITLGATGELTVIGLTPSELERLIVERSSARLRNPEVTVVVTKLGEQRVYIGGEVIRPGFVPLRPDMTVLQAVLQSGGFRKTARLDSVLLMSPGADGHFSAARVDMQSVVEAGVPERVRLHPNTVVYVPQNWIGNMNDVVDQWVRGLIPALPRVGVGYSLSQGQ